MSALFSFYGYLSFLLVLALSHSCISNQILLDNKDVLCMEGERGALLEFKQGLIDEIDRLASWVGEDRNCCGWAGIVCDNITGHVRGIHLQGVISPDLYEGCDRTRQLGGNLSSSLLHLKQLRHLDLSCNNFGGIQVPEFIGSLTNLRYLNISKSYFSGIIPPQLGNLSRLHVLGVGSSFHVSYEKTRVMNMQWLSSLRSLHHLDMSGVNLSKAIDWFQVISTLPSLTELHLSYCDIIDIHPHVPSLNITSLSLLDLSNNDLSSFMPQWVFSITNLVSLDLSWCNIHSLIHGNIDSFRNLTSLKSLHVSRNDFMNSSLVLKGLSSTVAGNLVSLKTSFCGVSSSVLNSLHNLTSLRSLDLSANELTNKIPRSVVNICNLKDIDLSSNNFGNISLSYLLGDFLQCESRNGRSSHLEELDVTNSNISGTIPEFIGKLTSMRRLLLGRNSISGPIPHWIGRLSSLEHLELSNNGLDGFLPDGLGNLSKLEWLTFSNNLLTGVVTEAHFAKLESLKYLYGTGNNLTLRPRLANWIPSFQLRELDLSSWGLGPQFPLWLQSQTHLIDLNIKNTGISSAMPVAFLKSFPNLWSLDMSHNHIQGMLLDIPATLRVLDLSFNEFSGELPKLSKGSFLYVMDLSSNNFVGSVHRLLCSKSVNKNPDDPTQTALNLGNNHLSGVLIPECWDKWQELNYLNLENNHLTGEIPGTLGHLHQLQSLNLRGNKLSGIPASLMNLKYLEVLQIGRNELVGSIPKWLGNLSNLRDLNLRYNNLGGNIPYELCYLTLVQILDVAHNNLSGNIPRCFNNFSVLSGKEYLSILNFAGFSISSEEVSASDSLVMKGREDTYDTILGMVTLLDLSSNNLVGPIPSELTALGKLQSLNLSRNQLTGRIPEKIGDMKSLETLDLSLNKLSGKLPLSLSRLTFLLSFNVSWNQLTGTVPTSIQLQSFHESSFFSNKLCGDPLKRCLPTEVPNEEIQKEDNVSHGATDWGLITSIVVGIVVGFWVIVAPLMVSETWRIAYFHFLSELRYMVYDIFYKYVWRQHVF
uniref:receptor-like protein EIX1 n=1 Tax=Erigeron canadensis TaxID=72917 RepID=UPI001CB8D7C4|nr:receptor-like protein EIX1 [Erigeron canadensis]